MSKFKSGDKAKILRFRNKFKDDIKFGGETKIGDVITLEKPYDDGSDMEFWLFKEGFQYIRADDLELVEEETPMPTPEYSCIRVVPPSKPKREIVEGKIILNEGATIKVMKDGADDDVKLIIQESPFFTAKALREAAALFTTLAEVLEENENA